MTLLDLYLEYVKPIKGSTAYHTWALLSVCSALLERRCWIDRGRLGIIFPNTYTILVGPPATGKSTSASIAVDLLSKIKPAGRKPPHFGPTKITQAALYKELKDAERTTTIDGGTYKTSPLFIYASELAINMEDFGGGTLTNELIDFYDSKGLDNVQYKRTISDGTLKLWNPSVTMLGCTTESFLQKAASEKLITSGLASRIVFVVEPNRVEKQRLAIEPDDALLKQLMAKFNQLFTIHGPIRFDDEANAAHIAVSEAADAKCYEAIGDFYQNYYGRKPDHIAKICMVFAAMRGGNVIRKLDVERATALIETLEPTMIKAFGIRAIHKDSDLAAQIMSALPRDGFISRRDLLDKLYEGGKFIPLNGDFEATLKGLYSMGRIDRIGMGEGDNEVYKRK